MLGMLIRFAAASDPLAQLDDDDVEDRHQREVECTGEEHSAEQRRPERLTAQTSRARCNEQGENSADEGQRRHDDWTEARLGGLDRRRDDIATASTKLVGEFHDENGILTRE